MKSMGKEWVGFSLHGVPSPPRQKIKIANLETNFWNAGNKKNENQQKIIGIITDISVKSGLFEYFFHENSGKSFPEKFGFWCQ
jgi:hypothetical protein